MTFLDPQTAKRLASQFAEQIETVNMGRIKALSTQFRKNQKSLTKKFCNLSQLFNSEKNDFVIHHSEFGSRKNPIIGMTVLHHIDFNHGVEREETLLAAKQHYITKIPLDFIISERTQFTVSTHTIHRILERHPGVSCYTFNSIFDLIRKELEYATLHSSIINTFLMTGTVTGSIPKNLVYGENFLSFPIPSKNGCFIGHIHRGILSLRTFLSDNEMNTKQLFLRDQMIALTDKFLSVNYPYFIQKTLEFDNGRNIPFALFYLSAIFYDIKELFKEILVEAFSDNYPKGQKIHVLNKLIKYVDEFPGTENEEDLKNRNASLCKAIAEKEDLALLRKWLIEFNRVAQREKLL